MEEPSIDDGRRNLRSADVLEFHHSQQNRPKNVNVEFIDDNDNDNNDNDEIFNSALLNDLPLESQSGIVNRARSIQNQLSQYEFHLIAMLTASTIISYADRQNMSLAINEILLEMGEIDKDGNVDQTIEGYLLAAFFVGYILTQLPGGWLAQRIGGRRVLAMGSIIWSICTILIPLAASAGFWWLMLLRVGLGIGEGVCFPSIHVIVSNWIPDVHKARTVAIVTAGSYMGNMAALFISQPLINLEQFGWRYAFYVFGAAGFVWNAVWHMIARRGKPEDHRTSDDEEDSGDTLPNQMRAGDDDDQFTTAIDANTRLLESPEGSSDAVPWKKLLLNRTTFAMLVNAFCYSWGFYVLTSWLPTYFRQWDGRENSIPPFLLILVPYIAQGFVGVTIGLVADWLVIKRRWSVLAVRQLAQGVGMMGPAIALSICAMSSPGPVAAMFWLTMALGLSSCTAVGHSLIQHDIAPQFAGVLFAIGNMVSTLPGMIGVATTGILLNWFQGKWQAPLGVCAVFCFIGAMVWFAFARTKRIV